jgi:hypothetical protein
MARKLLAAICLAATLGGTPLFAQDANRTLITTALEETDIFSDRQFVLDATISLSNKKSRSEGTYQLIWLGPERWKEHIQIGPEYVTRIGAKDSVYERASSATAEEMLLIFGKLFRFRAELEFPLQRNSRLKKEKVLKWQCVAFESNSRVTAHHICFEQGHVAHTHNLGRQMARDDSYLSEIPEALKQEDYQPSLGKTFPYQLSSEYRGAVFMAKVKSIVAVDGDHIEPSAFATDASFRAINSCFAPVGEDKIKAEPLRLPFQRWRGSTVPDQIYGPGQEIAGLGPAMAAQQFNVMVFTTISERGTVESTRLLSPVTGFEMAVLDAIRKSKYDPALCNGKPSSYSTIIDLRFLSYPNTP